MNTIYQMAPQAQTTGEYLATVPLIVLVTVGIIRSKLSRR